VTKKPARSAPAKPTAKPEPAAPAVPSRLMTARDAQPVGSFYQDLERRLKNFDLFSDTPAPAAPQPSEEDLQAQRDFAEVFGSDAGRRALEFLADRSVRQALVVDPFTVDPQRGWAMAQRAEGRNDLFFLILAQIAAAQDEPAPRRDGPQS